MAKQKNKKNYKRNKRSRSKKKKGKYSHWPDKKELKEAVDFFYSFRLLCQYQMNVDLWTTTDFPSKHQLNQILGIQYIDTELLGKVYGKKLAEAALEMLPYCKAYILFVKDAPPDMKGDGYA